MACRTTGDGAPVSRKARGKGRRVILIGEARPRARRKEFRRAARQLVAQAKHRSAA